MMWGCGVVGNLPTAAWVLARELKVSEASLLFDTGRKGMASCATCRRWIIFGGKREGGRRYCSKACLGKGRMQYISERIPEDLVRQTALDIHTGTCPVCRLRRGPIDVHTSHTVWSFILLTSWRSNDLVSCRDCGRAKQVRATLFSLFAGWWGFPFGFVMTPVQITRNLAGILRPAGGRGPSARLEQAVRSMLSGRLLADEANDQGRGI
jgi:hypothetical protein